MLLETVRFPRFLLKPCDPPDIGKEQMSNSVFALPIGLEPISHLVSTDAGLAWETLPHADNTLRAGSGSSAFGSCFLAKDLRLVAL
jgi:hypothetical protein